MVIAEFGFQLARCHTVKAWRERSGELHECDGLSADDVRQGVTGSCVGSFGRRLFASNPGTWNQQQVEEKLKSSLSLAEIQLTPRTEGGYSGKGKTYEGESYKLQITQDPTRKRLEWKFESDRGDIGDAYYELE